MNDDKRDNATEYTSINASAYVLLELCSPRGEMGETARRGGGIL